MCALQFYVIATLFSSLCQEKNIDKTVQNFSKISQAKITTCESADILLHMYVPFRCICFQYSKIRKSILLDLKVHVV